MSKIFNKEMNIDELRRRLAEAKRTVVINPEEIEEAEALLHVKLIEQANKRLDRTTETLQASNRQLDHVTTVMQRGFTAQQELRQAQRRYTRFLALAVIATVVTVSLLTHQRMDSIERLAIARSPETALLLANRPPVAPFIWASFAMEGLDQIGQIANDVAFTAATQPKPDPTRVAPLLVFNGAYLMLEGLDYLNEVSMRLGNTAAETPLVQPLVIRFEPAMPTAASSWVSTTRWALRRTGYAAEDWVWQSKAWMASGAVSLDSTVREALKQTGRMAETLAQQTRTWVASLTTPVTQPKTNASLPKETPQPNTNTFGLMYGPPSPDARLDSLAVDSRARQLEALNSEETVGMEIGKMLETPIQDMALLQAARALEAIDVALNDAAEIVSE